MTGALRSAERLCSQPITGIAFCCAGTASGQPAAAPTSSINVRRCMSLSKTGTASNPSTPGPAADDLPWVGQVDPHLGYPNIVRVHWMTAIGRTRKLHILLREVRCRRKPEAGD